MRTFVHALLASLFISSSLFTITTHADTPDGLTPAQETVCDPLKADGITKGLYGLCVAFCEAHDYADPSIPLTEADLDVITKSAPSGRILSNYNKKMTATDPPMPCIVVEPPCPCWTSEELSSIDGYLPNGQSVFDVGVVTPTDASHQEDGQLAFMRFYDDIGMYGCGYLNFQESNSVFRSFGTSEGTMTSQEGQTCRDMLVNSIYQHGH